MDSLLEEEIQKALEGLEDRLDTWIYDAEKVSDHREDLLDFISQALHRVVEVEREEMKEKIIKYFEGLIIIPFPQATRDSILDLISHSEDKETKCKICESTEHAPWCTFAMHK